MSASSRFISRNCLQVSLVRSIRSAAAASARRRTAITQNAVSLFMATFPCFALDARGHGQGRRVKPAASFDHLVGAGEECRGNVEAERFGGLEVDNQFVFGRLLHRKIGRLLALDDAVN